MEFRKCAVSVQVLLILLLARREIQNESVKRGGDLTSGDHSCPVALVVACALDKAKNLETWIVCHSFRLECSKGLNRYNT